MIFRNSLSIIVDRSTFASILIVPSFANDTVSTAGNQSQPTPSDKRLGRTQLLYNCTSATNLWNLLGDSNVLKLEDFQQFPSSDSSTVESSSGSSANTSTSRDIVAVAVVQIADCATIENTSMGRPVVLNSFFGTGFQNSSPSYLYITNTVVLALDVSQCYSCYSESKLGNVVAKNVHSESKPNRSTITNPSMLLYTSGDCSDPTNPSNDCCRITCENCFINMSIASLYAAVDVYSSSLDYYTATEMKLVGNSAINVKVVSPNGCKLESTTLKSFRISPLSIPLGLTSLEVDFTVDFIGELAIKPHGTSAEIGVTKSTVKYPELFAALPTSYLDDSSKYRGGDCTKPHFMEYRGIYGYKPVQMASFATIEIPWDSDLAYDKPPVQFGSEYSSSLFSGCISSEYDAIMHLTTAANAVTSATVTKISTALQKILMWALKFPDIDPNFLKISIHSSGQISVTIAVPPSVADQFPTQSELETQFYQVARTTSFSDTVSSFVGLSIVSQCESGFWGATCLSACTSPNCATVTCNSATGVVTLCTSCKQGYWGSPSCSSTCNLPKNCKPGTVSCDSKGKAISCTACNEGWWGPTCTKKCTYPRCGAGTISCELDGTITSCSSCIPGYWGSTCRWWGQTCSNECTSPNCKTGSVSCDSEGIAISCSSCDDGWWGETCSDQCTSPNCKTGNVTCDSEGDTISCSECEEGWWGRRAIIRVILHAARQKISPAIWLMDRSLGVAHATRDTGGFLRATTHVKLHTVLLARRAATSKEIYSRATHVKQDGGVRTAAVNALRLTALKVTSAATQMTGRCPPAALARMVTTDQPARTSANCPNYVRVQVVNSKMDEKSSAYRVRTATTDRHVRRSATSHTTARVHDVRKTRGRRRVLGLQ
ncbi:hypothetical protein GQ600_6414 [Phytophthora cactorum]|nr:hypothetical protein GQ600_6414 [Phytophthora cactorum]